jgi:predicted ATPase
LDRARLVTLTGPGGTGKTRLGLQVAAGSAGFYPDGATFVGLASIDDPALVPNAIAHKLGVVERANQPLIELLQRYLSNKHLLLVLDNYEHVLEAAPLVSELLMTAPQLKVLATSREVLRLNGEFEYPVPPLSVPDQAQLGPTSSLLAFESVALFSQRAQAAVPGFRLNEENAPAVAAICTRLDGLPLAIELAAARVKRFKPGQLLERLEDSLGLLTRGPRDLPARQRTLRSTIDWSHNLLDGGEQILFARLGVFQGGRSIDAVEAICGPGLPIDPLDGLESLLDKNLLVQEEGPGGEPRFIMLETIHEYAREKLVGSGEEGLLRDRHLAYFLSLAEEMEPGYRRHNQLLLLDRTEAEMGNLRVAFNWALERGDVEKGARLVSAIDYFLYYKDRFVEGYRWINRLLKTIDEIAPEYQARLLLAAGRLSYNIGDVEPNKAFCRQALALAQELDDRGSAAWALIYLGGASVGRPEEYQEAEKFCEEGLAIFQDLGEKPGMAQALNILGELARTVGDYQRARDVYDASLVISRQTGEKYRQILLQGNLSYVAYHEGNYESARELSVSYLNQIYMIGTELGTLDGLAQLAGPLGKLGELEKAARLLGATAALMSAIGFDHQAGDQLEIDKYEADVRARLDEDVFKTAWAEGQAMTLEQAVAYALEDD